LITDIVFARKCECFSADLFFDNRKLRKRKKQIEGMKGFKRIKRNVSRSRIFKFRSLFKADTQKCSKDTPIEEKSAMMTRKAS